MAVSPPSSVTGALGDAGYINPTTRPRLSHKGRTLALRTAIFDNSYRGFGQGLLQLARPTVPVAQAYGIANLSVGGLNLALRKLNAENPFQFQVYRVKVRPA